MQHTTLTFNTDPNYRNSFTNAFEAQDKQKMMLLKNDIDLAIEQLRHEYESMNSISFDQIFDNETKVLFHQLLNLNEEISNQLKDCYGKSASFATLKETKYPMYDLLLDLWREKFPPSQYAFNDL